MIGQYLGFGAILLVVARALGAARLPGHAAAYLGLVPVALGVHEGVQSWRHRREPGEGQGMQRAPAWAVAGVTLASGGDDVGVYIPALATYSTAVIGGIALVFLILVAAWCTAGYCLSAHRLIAVAMQRWGHVIHPAAMIAIGLTVLISGGALSL